MVTGSDKMETSARRIIRLCTKRGLLDDTAADRLADEEPVLAALTAASVRGLTATGARAGQRLRRVLKDPATGVRTAPLCFASRSRRRGRMGRAISCCLRWNCWRSWRLWFPRPGSISYATTGSWRPGPGPATSSFRPSRLPSRRRRTARRALRPAAIGCGGRPCWRGCFPPTQRMRGLWRSPENHRRPDRSGLDPALSGGGRAAGEAPAEGPA